MAVGDAAVAAGMDTVPGTADRRDGYAEINKTRDYIANAGTASPTPNTVMRRNGDGVVAAASPTSPNHLATKGYTDDAVGNAGTSAPTANTVMRRAAGGVVAVGEPTGPSHATTKKYVDDRVSGSSDKVSKSGDTMSGDLYLPNASAAQNNYSVAYINGDGRVCRGASSSRWKKGITREPDLPDVFAAPFASWVMRQDADETVRYGFIAEDLAKHDGTAGFVTYDDKGLPSGYDMIGLLLAQVEVLRRRVADLESR